MHYGIIDFTTAEIDLLAERLRATSCRLSRSAEEADTLDERTFYTTACSLLQIEIEMVATLKPGKRGLGEEQINRLRSVLVEARHGDLARRCVSAKRNGDANLPSLETEYLTWTVLREKLAKPFTEDRSHDGESDEDTA